MYNKSIIAWAMYDWANSAFATTVMAGFFPLFFKLYYSAGSDALISTAQLGFSNSIASLVVALIAPVLGAIADSGFYKKKFLLFFAAIGILMTASLYFVEKGMWEFAAFIYVSAAIGFAGSNLFYDSLLPMVASKKESDRVSVLGFSLGYLGGGILFLINVMMYKYPESFGISDQIQAIKISFVSVALWWVLFSLPLMIFVKERKGRISSLSKNITEGYRSIIKTFQKIRTLKTVSLFLIAYWLYIDGVNTIIRMAIDYGMSIGLETSDLIVSLLIVQFIGFPATLLFGKLSHFASAKSLIIAALCVYIFVTTWAVFIDSSSDFFILALLIGMVQGGIQALSRSFYLRIIPHNNIAEFFGFYNLLGKFAAILGPLMIGFMGMATGNSRIGIASIVLLFLAGGFLLLKVDENQGEKESRQFEEDNGTFYRHN